MTDEREGTAIRALIEEWAAAVREMNMDGILRHHSRDIVMFDVPPPLESRGLDAYQATWKLFFRWSRKPVAFDLKRLEIRAGSDVAFALALMHCQDIEPDGRATELDFRLTIGLEKIDGRWTVVHEHHSVPAES